MKEKGFVVVIARVFAFTIFVGVVCTTSILAQSQTGPNTAGTPAYERGSAAERAGNWNHAIQEFTEAIRLDPNWFVYYRLRGNNYEKIGDYNNAIFDYNQALQLMSPRHNLYRSVQDMLARAQQLAASASRQPASQSSSTQHQAQTQGVIRESDFNVIQNPDNTITIAGYNGNVKNMVIPETLYGLRVTAIGREAFLRKGLTSVLLPDTLVTIGDYAFANGISDVSSTYSGQRNTLTEILIPNSVMQIGEGAFQGYIFGSAVGNIQEGGELTKVSFGSGIQTIGANAFRFNKLTDLVLPDSVTTIGGRAFASNQLSNVNFGRRTQTIEYEAFSRNNLSTITLPDTVRTIGQGAFSNNQLQSIAIPNGSTVYRGAFADNPLNTLVLPASANFEPLRAPWTVFGNLPLTRITIPTNMSDRDLESAGFEINFINFYTGQRKAAGTYVRNGPIWSLERN